MPLISDPRFAPDTLFLVAEEDWRLWKADCKKEGKLQKADLPEDRQEELSAPSGSQDAYPAVKAFSDPSSSSFQPTKNEGELRSWGRGTKASAADVQQTSQELLDILHMCNTAHRQGHGDVVWLSYNVAAKASWAPSYGSTLLAVSARGGRILHDNWSEWFKEPQHFDIALKEVLMELSASQQLPASYVFPSVGGYDEHISAFMNTKKAAVRECYWDTYKAIQQGTREFDQHGRAFSRSLPWQKYKLKEFPLEQKYRDKFEVVILDEIPTLPLDQPDIWWTAAATIDEAFYEEAQQQHSTTKGASKGSGVARSFQPSKRPGSPTRQLPWKWRKLRGAAEPQHASIADSDASQIKISLDQMWHPHETSEFKTTNAQRRMRNNVSNFERRYFTNDPSKVALHSVCCFVSKNIRASTIYFSSYMGRYSIASHIPHTGI